MWSQQRFAGIVKLWALTALVLASAPVLWSHLPGTPSAATAWADSWIPPGPRIFVSASGKFGVLVVPLRRGSRFTTFSSATPVEADAKNAGELLELPEGVTKIHTGELDRVPYRVVVSDKGAGFLAIDTWGRLGRGEVVTAISNDGTIHYGKTLADLYDEPDKIFRSSVSSTWWYKDGWFDDDQGVMFLVSNSPGDAFFKAISFESGEVRQGALDDIHQALLLKRNKRENIAPLELLLHFPPHSATDHVRRIFESAKSLDSQVRAGALLARDGDFRARDLYRQVLAEARDQESPQRLGPTDFAIKYSGMVLGADAVPLLRDLMRGKAGPYWGACQNGFFRVGEAAVPPLVAMLEEQSESNDYRGGAAHTLKKIGSKNALPALLRTIADPSEYVANAAINAAIAIGAAEIAADLLVHLQNGTTQDGRIAMYFSSHKHPGADKALEKLLEEPRDTWKDFDLKRLREAVEFQRQ